MQRQPSKVYAVTSFGLFAGLLRQRCISDALVESEFFNKIKTYTNSIGVLEEFGAKNPPQSIQQLNAKIASLELEIERLTRPVSVSPSSLSFSSLSASSSPVSSSCSSSPVSSSCSSSPVSSSCSSSPSIDEIKVSPLGRVKKKKSIQERCRTILSDLNKFFDSINETLSSVCGHVITHGSDEDSEFVKHTLSELFSHVMKEKGAQSTILSLVNDEVTEELIKSMRVADWCLLYLKLSARIPDAAWQTLLNITHLGKSGVSLVY